MKIRQSAVGLQARRMGNYLYGLAKYKQGI
jgi:hypothetical protein